MDRNQINPDYDGMTSNTIIAIIAVLTGIPED